MMKRHVTSLHKQKIDEQVLYEFRLFSYGFIPRLDEQNNILIQLVTM